MQLMKFDENKAIYIQIANRICDEVLVGKYKEDERIPSVREYAALVEVNANTVMRSFDYLQSRGIIYNKRGIGYFVSLEAKNVIIKGRKEQFLNEEIDYFFNQVNSLGITGNELLTMYDNYLRRNS